MRCFHYTVRRTPYATAAHGPWLMAHGSRRVAYGAPAHLEVEEASVKIEYHIGKEVRVDELVDEVQRIQHVNGYVGYRRLVVVSVRCATNETDLERRHDRDE